MSEVSYWGMETDAEHPKEIMEEIVAGRLRQGWGYANDQDLREVSKLWNWTSGNRKNLSFTQEETVRNLAFLRANEPGMMKPGDIVLVPNLPDREHFVLCELTEQPHCYELLASTKDHGHIRNVKLLTPSGILKRSEAGERLRTT